MTPKGKKKDLFRYRVQHILWMVKTLSRSYLIEWVVDRVDSGNTDPRDKFILSALEAMAED